MWNILERKIEGRTANEWNNEGIASHKLGRYPEAIKCYNKSLELNPKYVEACNNRDLALRRLFTKEGMKQHIESLFDLRDEDEVKLKILLFELVDKAPEANEVLLNTIADVLDLQADYLEKSAALLEEEADLFEKIGTDIVAIEREDISIEITEFLSGKGILFDHDKEMTEESMENGIKTLKELSLLLEYQKTVTNKSKEIIKNINETARKFVLLENQIVAMKESRDNEMNKAIEKFVGSI